MTLRPDREIAEIRQHLANLRQADWLGPARQWWPDCLFHCTDITNAASILRQGELLSRSLAVSTSQLAVDIAAPEVIAHTNPQWQDYVRLYFRPKTPTQYQNEGFRPVGQREFDSHCPVLVYFIFDALAVLSREDCLFTEGNAAAVAATPSGAVSFLKQIPFDLVYHDSWFDPSERRQIVHRRAAEVLVPQRMGLESLRYIGCRSPAERETLWYLLPRNTRSRWLRQIVIKPSLFNRKWTFVERVEMSDTQLVFRFNRSSEPPGPFDAQVVLQDTAIGCEDRWHYEAYQAKATLEISLRNLRNSPDYTARLSLDNQLAYANRYQKDDLPF